MNSNLPFPIFQGTDKITDVELGTPGQLVLDQQGHLLREYLKYSGFTLPFRKAYNLWIDKIVPLQIKSNVWALKDGSIIIVDRVDYRSPYNDNTGRKPIYPRQARDEEKTYELTIIVDYKYISKRGEIQYERNAVYGRIPLMLGTKYCHLWNKTDRELIALGECYNDPLGYFIINGTERLILLQEKMRLNKIVTFYDTNIKAVSSNYTVSTYKGSKKIQVIIGKFRELELHMGGLPNGVNINLFVGFRFLGIENPLKAVQLIKNFIPEKHHRKTDNLLLLTVTEALKISDVYEYIADVIKESKTTRDEKIKRVNAIIVDNFFPNLGDYSEEKNFSRALLLSQMTARVLQYMLGIQKLDDRDNYANKRIESPARSMEQLFTSLLGAHASKIQTDLEKPGVSKQGIAIVKDFSKSYLSDHFSKAFGTDAWGVPGSKIKQNITDILKRESITSTLAQLTRINTPTSGFNANITIRLVHPSQCGYICLTGDTEVLLANGISTKKIADMSNDDQVLTINPETLQEEASGIKGYFKIIPKRVLKINTLSDREVKCSPDHPLLVARKDKFEWVHACDLKVGDYLIMRNYQSQLEKKGKLLMIDSQNIIPQHINELKKNNLLDVNIDEERMAILARLAGALWTDGHLGNRKTSSGWFAEFYLGEEADAKEIIKDIEKLGFNVTQYKPKISNYTDENNKEIQYLTYRVYKGGAFGSLMKLLGIPSGKKGNQESPLIPQWIINGSLNVKREFLSAFQGGDGGRISMAINGDHYKIQCGPTQQTCSPEFAESHFKFINQLATLFRELGIECDTYQGKVKDKIINCFRINNTYQNIYKYSSIIEYRYANEKTRASALPIEYIRYRMKLINDKQNLYQKVKELFKQSMRQCDIARKLSIDTKLVSRILSREDDYKVSFVDRSAMKYTEFTNTVLTYDKRVFVPITSIEDTNIEPVYDFTTISKNHSFYANGVIVKNCPTSSPEGERAGLIKSLAITCYPSIENPDQFQVLAVILMRHRYNPISHKFDANGEPLIDPLFRRENNQLVINNSPARSFLVMIEGIPIGWGKPDMVKNYVVNDLRRKGAYPEITAINLSEFKLVDIYIGGARPLRPLLIIDPADHQIIALRKGHLEKSFVNEITQKGESYLEFLMKNGELEYLDAYEQDSNAIIAQTFAQLQIFNNELKEATRQLQDAENEFSKFEDTKEDDPEFVLAENRVRSLVDLVAKLQRRPLFTHCELDPTSIFGHTASTIPLSSSNVAPRNMFTVGMTNQSLGIYHSNQAERFDVAAKTMAYPTRPMFETQANEAIGLSEMPNGQTVRVAIMSYLGFNQEDGFIFNQRSIDLGLFTTVKYITYKTATINSRDFHEVIAKSVAKDEKMAHRLRNLEDNGLPKEGSYMEVGDVVIGKIRKSGGKDIFAGEVIGIGDEGVVHRVKISKNNKQNITVRVMIRQIRKPEVGDKFASRSAQKGTIGLILPAEQMPWIESGTEQGHQPDIIINAHAIPSRMTIGKMIEIVASKVGLIRGERMNATSFRPIDHRGFRDTLIEYGFNPRGNETMISGITGERFDTEIFIGPCYYSSLGKDVKDKIQARSSASVDPSSHEPTRGRTNASGKAIRVGTQEATAFVGHGAPSILRERLNDSSDGYRTPFCKNCGNIAINNVDLKKGPSCRNCKEKASFGQRTIPGSFKLMQQILGGLNINQTLGLGYQNEKFVP